MVKESDIYEYENIPTLFKRQFGAIVAEFYSSTISSNLNFWSSLSREIRIEFGEINLGYGGDPRTEVLNYFLKSEGINTLDLVDIIVKYLCDNSYLNDRSEVVEAVKKINQKFKQNGLGYEIVGSHLFRIDNQFIHSEIVKLSIRLLQEEKFHSVSDEFLKAHEHFKNGDYKDAIVNAGKSFESAMKKICVEKNYPYNAQKDTASTLINILLKSEFIPSYMQNQFVGLKNTLENSVPTLRNRFGGHGQGELVVNVPESIVKYTINLCATNIVFLIERYKEVK